MTEQRRRRKRTSNGSEPQKDRLGKLIKEYRVTLAGLIVICGTVLLIGAGCVAYGFTREPRSIGFLIFGGVVVLCGVILLFLNIFNVGRSLELRKRGVRFHEAGSETEFRWDEIVDIEVQRRDETNYGVATAVRESDDGVSPSGLLTKTEWRITIHSDSGQTIELTPTFLRMVEKPQELVSLLKLRSGIQ